jgi:DNA-binding CsgD family transcriptional regulator
VLVGGVKARLIPLAGTDGQRIALLLEPLLTREALEGAAARYRLSPRESDVVRGLLDGASVSEIAGGLGIAESTVGDYLKRLFAKTRVRNRAEMIAKLLGWQTPEKLP